MNNPYKISYGYCKLLQMTFDRNIIHTVNWSFRHTQTELVRHTKQSSINSTYILNKNCPPTPAITLNRARTKIFASVSKETSPIQITRVLGNERLNTDKIFARPSKNSTSSKESRKTMAISKRFAWHAKAIRINTVVNVLLCTHI